MTIKHERISKNIICQTSITSHVCVRERERKKESTQYNIYIFICNNHFIVIYIIYKTIPESRLSSSSLDKMTCICNNKRKWPTLKCHHLPVC